MADRSRMHMIDAVWLDVEQQDAPIAVGAVMEFSGRAPAIDRVRKRIAEVVPLAPRLSQIPEESWDGLRQPTWIDAELDLDTHIVRQAVDDLQTAVSELMSEPMRTDRPLWDIRIYTGYAPREWAMVWRLHHSLADGEGATMLMGRAIEMQPDGGDTLTDWLVAQANLVRVAQADTVAETDEVAEFEPGVRDRVLNTLRDVGDSAGALAAAAPATLRSLLRMAPAVPTPISGSPSVGRDWRSLHMPLGEVKAAGKAHGATINDVLLAAVANGFREVLLAHEQMGPGRVVRAVMPVSTRRPGDVRSNNQVSMIPVELPVVHEDPSRRLAEVVRQTRQGKSSMVPQVIAALQDAIDRLVPAPLLEVLVAKGGWTIGWVADTLVTNVRGPAVPQYFLGHEVRFLSPIIPVGSSLRTVVGINSYNGWVNVAVTGDADHAEDNQILIDGIHQAVLDLLE